MSDRSTPSKALLITGVSSGIGLGMAKRFLREGYRVFGSVRSEEKANELRRTLGEAFSPLVFDVCDQEGINRAEQVLRTSLPDSGLAALINNAGGAEIGPLLHVAPESLQRHLDTLVVGQLRVTQRFFKYLLAHRPSPGRIINISSVSGVGVNTFFGCYGSAKHALEGLSKTLREEVRGYGINVVVVAPGNIATDIWPKQRPDLIEEYRNTDYYPALKKSIEWISTNVAQDAMSVEEFVAALYGIFINPAPAERYTIFKGKNPRLPLSRFRVRVIEA